MIVFLQKFRNTLTCCVVQVPRYILSCYSFWGIPFFMSIVERRLSQQGSIKMSFLRICLISCRSFIKLNIVSVRILLIFFRKSDFIGILIFDIHLAIIKYLYFTSFYKTSFDHKLLIYRFEL